MHKEVPENAMQAMLDDYDRYKSETIASKSFYAADVDDIITAELTVVRDTETGEIVNGGVGVRNGGCCYLNRDFVSYRDALEVAEDVAHNYAKYAKEWRV